MPIAIAELREVMSARTLQQYRQRSIARRLYGNHYQSEADAGNRVIKIPSQALTVTVRDYTRGDPWGTPDQPTASHQEMYVDPKHHASVKIDWATERQTVLNTLEHSRQAIEDAFVDKAEEDLITYITADAQVPAAQRADAASLGQTNIPVWDLSDEQFTFTADNTRANLGRCLYAFMHDTRRSLSRLGAVDGERDNVNAWVACHPDVYDGWLEYVRSLDLSQEINVNAFARARAFAGRGFKTVWRDLVVMTSWKMPEPTSGTAMPAAALIGTDQACEYVDAPGVTQYISPQMNQTGPDHRLNQATNYDKRLVDNRTLFRLDLTAAA